MTKILIKQGEYTLKELQKLFKEKKRLKYPNGAVVEALEKEQRYFYINNCGDVGFYYFYNDYVDKYALLTRNVFLTQEEAEKEAKRRKRYFEIINEIDRINRKENWVAKWSDANQSKEYLYYTYISNRFHFICDKTYTCRQHCIYMCKKAIHWVMSLPDKDKKILIGIYD